MSKLRLGYDLETNGLMPMVDTIWCLVVVNADTNEVRSYSDHDEDLPSLDEGLAYLHTADIIFGHNVIGYDNVVLQKLKNWYPLPTQKVIDTWILSLLVQYQRKHKHGLEGWGTKLGFPKIDWDEWDKYTKDMLNYCIRDVELNVKVYKHLAEEATKIIKKHPSFTKGMDVEMEFAKIESDIQHKGWMFDMEAACKLLEDLEIKMHAIEHTLEPLIGMRCIKTDGLETKSPAWRKDGCYTIATVKHFGYSQESGKEERPIEGPYSRISFEQGKVGQIEVVKDYLYSIGWVPDEWNFEKINGKFVKKSPKITESSLEKLGGSAITISEYYTLRSRQGVLKGWIESVQSSADKRLHGKMWTIGTPTFRCRHEVVANIPSIDSIYGKEMRSLLVCEQGTSIVGADSSGNQMRGLCHYIGNDTFTNEVINGDVHQRNADALGVSRKLAKPFLYAFLFGGGAGKLGSILTGNTDAKVGAKAKEKFQDSIPGMKQLTDKLEDEFKRTEEIFGKENGFIRGLDGRIVFVKSKHQVLNYLLQTAEGVTCKAAVVYAKRELLKRKIPHYIVLHYHDEFAIVTPDQYTEEVAELAVEAFTEAPKWFGIECMNGAAHIGKKYSDVH
jgi:DNA polymerase I-like protein with 3'-5' exonuclease and polymerase domains